MIKSKYMSYLLVGYGKRAKKTEGDNELRWKVGGIVGVLLDYVAKHRQTAIERENLW